MFWKRDHLASPIIRWWFPTSYSFEIVLIELGIDLVNKHLSFRLNILSWPTRVIDSLLLSYLLIQLKIINNCWLWLLLFVFNLQACVCFSLIFLSFLLFSQRLSLFSNFLYNSLMVFPSNYVINFFFFALQNKVVFRTSDVFGRT